MIKLVAVKILENNMAEITEGLLKGDVFKVYGGKFDAGLRIRLPLVYSAVNDKYWFDAGTQKDIIGVINMFNYKSKKTVKEELEQKRKRENEKLIRRLGLRK